MYGHTLRTHEKFGGIVPLGGAIIEQNMKLPLTTTVGLMLASVVLGPVIAACSYILYIFLYFF